MLHYSCPLLSLYDSCPLLFFSFFFFAIPVQDYTGRLYDCDFNQQLATQMLLKNSSNHTQVQLLRK
jgi:hypothetical protein